MSNSDFYITSIILRNSCNHVKIIYLVTFHFLKSVTKSSSTKTANFQKIQKNSTYIAKNTRLDQTFAKHCTYVRERRPLLSPHEIVIHAWALIDQIGIQRLEQIVDFFHQNWFMHWSGDSCKSNEPFPKSCTHTPEPIEEDQVNEYRRIDH